MADLQDEGQNSDQADAVTLVEAMDMLSPCSIPYVAYLLWDDHNGYIFVYRHATIYGSRRSVLYPCKRFRGRYPLLNEQTTTTGTAPLSSLNARYSYYDVFREMMCYVVDVHIEIDVVSEIFSNASQNKVM